MGKSGRLMVKQAKAIAMSFIAPGSTKPRLFIKRSSHNSKIRRHGWFKSRGKQTGRFPQA
jgi:hypothetical protein